VLAASEAASYPAYRKPRGRSLNDIRNAIDGPPLSVGELAMAIGFSREKVRLDIKTGHLCASAVGLRARLAYRIEIIDAQRYLRALGF
jgi:hypothetical protein